MNKQMKVLSIFIIVGLFMTACGSSNTGGGTGGGGGGGTGGGGGGGTGGGGGGGTGGGGGSAQETYLFFKSGSISRIDPADSTATPVVVETGKTAGETDILHATLDIPNQRITDIHTRSIIYANTDNGKLYKISTLKSDSQTPVQVSNETSANKMCNPHLSETVSDLFDHSKSVYFYHMPGPDNDCNTPSNNELKMVRLEMSASDRPIVAMDWDTALLNPSTRALVGFLAFDGNKLVRCNQNFQNCSAVIPFSTSAEELSSNFSGDSILRVDNQLFHYDTVSGTLSSALHTFLGGVPGSVVFGAGETEMYFADSALIFKLPMDGSAQAAPFVVESGNTFFKITLTTNKVVYLANKGGVSVLKAVNKSGGTPATLIPSTTDSLDFLEFINGDFVFYFRQGSIKGVIKDDGTGGSEIPNASWSGISSTAVSSDGVLLDRVIWTEGCPPPTLSCAGGTVKSVDATNRRELILGIIPSDIVAFFISATGDGNRVLGEGLDDRGFENDIFFVNTNQANSLKRITSTPDLSEFSIPRPN